MLEDRFRTLVNLAIHTKNQIADESSSEPITKRRDHAISPPASNHLLEHARYFKCDYPFHRQAESSLLLLFSNRATRPSEWRKNMKATFRKLSVSIVVPILMAGGLVIGGAPSASAITIAPSLAGGGGGGISSPMVQVPTPKALCHQTLIAFSIFVGFIANPLNGLKTFNEVVWVCDWL